MANGPTAWGRAKGRVGAGAANLSQLRLFVPLAVVRDYRTTTQDTTLDRFWKLGTQRTQYETARFG